MRPNQFVRVVLVQVIDSISEKLSQHCTAATDEIHQTEEHTHDRPDTLTQ